MFYDPKHVQTNGENIMSNRSNNYHDHGNLGEDIKKGRKSLHKRGKSGKQSKRELLKMKDNEIKNLNDKLILFQS